MKTLLLPLVLAAGSAVGLSAGEASLSGKWKVHSSVSGTESDQSCTFTQKDNDLVGTCTTPEKGPVTITGKVNGSKITWSYKSEYEGTPLTVNFDGKLDSGNKIAGSVTVPEFSAEGDFAATRP